MKIFISFIIFTGFLVKSGVSYSDCKIEQIEWKKSTCARITGIIPLAFECRINRCVKFGVHFVLYTRDFKEQGKEIIYGDVESLKEAQFDENKPIKILTHGWKTDGDKFFQLVKNAILEKYDMNVITVIWKNGAQKCYPWARINAIDTAERVTEFIKWLVENSVKESNIHLIGHSLGAHIMGIAARNSKSNCITIPYITALDPTGIYWEKESQRIKSTDAEYVEVIHTDVTCLGIKESIGSNDFYPNRGHTQPGCKFRIPSCSHIKSYEYFAESIDHEGFMADQCTDYKEMEDGKCANLSRLHMGGLSPKPSKGIFYLKTNEYPPYYSSDSYGILYAEYIYVCRIIGKYSYELYAGNITFYDIIKEITDLIYPYIFDEE